MKRVIGAVIDFIAGDDVWLAVGVVCAVVLTAALAHHGLDPWWLLPVVVPTTVAVSLLRATRSRSLSGNG